VCEIGEQIAFPRRSSAPLASTMTRDFTALATRSATSPPRLALEHRRDRLPIRALHRHDEVYADDCCAPALARHPTAGPV
jgi:uncharacterized membrane-anchored protein YhcB (DUF1043 family)